MPGTIDRLLRRHRTILAVPVTELGDGTIVLVGPTGTTTPMANPSAAVLESWRQVTTTSQAGASRGGNISCALLDDVSLGFGDSDTDDELTICSVGNESSPIAASVDLQLTALRDRNKADTGVFNLATNLFKAPDVRFAYIDRIGPDWDAAFAAGDDINLFDAYTDNPLDIKEDKGNLKIQQNPAFTGNFLQNFTIPA